jgi:hypothetical protein
MDGPGRRAHSYGSEGWGSSPSERARSEASARLGEAFLLTDLLTAPSISLDRTGEDGCGLGELLADHMGIDPERDRRIGVSQPGRHHMDRHASPQERWAWMWRRS